MKTVKTVVLATAIGFAALAGGIVIAPSAQATERCEFPGIVANSSNHSMKIQYDDDSGVHVVRLASGEVSTDYTCDADFIMLNDPGESIKVTNYGGDHPGTVTLSDPGKQYKIGAYKLGCQDAGPGSSQVVCRGQYTGNQA